MQRMPRPDARREDVHLLDDTAAAAWSKITTCGTPPQPTETRRRRDRWRCVQLRWLPRCGIETGNPISRATSNQPFNGIFHRNSKIRVADVTDGTSNNHRRGRALQHVRGEVAGRASCRNASGVQPGQSTAAVQPGAKSALPELAATITSTVVHIRSSARMIRLVSPASFHRNTLRLQFLVDAMGSTRVLSLAESLWNLFRALATAGPGAKSLPGGVFDFENSHGLPDSDHPGRTAAMCHDRGT